MFGLFEQRHLDGHAMEDALIGDFHNTSDGVDS
jgi:hypothetical protein